MKAQRQPRIITVNITNSLACDAREAAFLRVMAQFCIANSMSGNAACERLIERLDEALIPKFDDKPVYGLFESS